MFKIVLHPCKVLQNKLIPTSEETLELDWSAYSSLLAPSKTKTALINLRRAKISSYVGLVRDYRGNIINFVFMAPDRTNKINWLLAKDKDFDKKIVSIYQVKSLVMDGSIKEH